MKNLKLRLLETVLDYIIDNGGKPHIAIHYDSANNLKASLPEGYERDGILTLSIYGNDIANYYVDNTTMHFDCSFNKIPMNCVVPLAAIAAIYDPATSDGLNFDINRDMQRAYSEKDVKREKVAHMGLRVVK